MVPVDGVEKQTLMLEPPCRIVFLHFAAVKKPQQNHTLAQSGHGCPFSHRRSDSPNVSGGTCGGRKQSRWRFCWLPTALLFSDARHSCSRSTLEIVIA